MAELSWPSPDNGREVTERQYELLSAQITEDGLVMGDDGTNLDPSGLAPAYGDSSGMVVKVRANIFGNVRGFGWTSGTSVISKSIGANSSGSTRTDWLALELSRSTWNVRLVVVAGSPGFGLPALTRDLGDSGLWQVPIAKVTVANAAVTIAPGAVSVVGHRIGSRVRAWNNASEMVYPKLGEIGFDNTTNQWFGWNGTEVEYLSGLTPPIPVGVKTNDGGTVTSTSLTETISGAGNISVTFTAGPRGGASVRAGSMMKTSHEFYDASFGARIRRVSDNVIIKTPDESELAVSDSLNNVTNFVEYIITGLTPGVQYKALGVYSIEGGGHTGTFDNRRIFVTPF